MENLGNSLKQLRLEHGYTMDKLSKLLNERYRGQFNFNKGKLSKWENNKEEPRLSSLKMLADFYEVNIDELCKVEIQNRTDFLEKTVLAFKQLNEQNQKDVCNYTEEKLKNQNKIIDFEKYQTTYVISKVSAGTGILNLDSKLGWEVEVKGSIPRHDLAFQVSGNSMEPTLKDDEIIYVEQVEDIRNGQLAVVMIDHEYYIKKVYIESNQLRLVSLNKEYEDIVANSDNQIKIIGRVIM